MKMLVTRPEFDPTTKYLSAWAGEIIDFAKNKGMEVIDLHKEKVTRNEFEGRVKKVDPDVIFFNGHGSDQGDGIGGHDNKALVLAGKNQELLYGKITYALACKSADVLGKQVVSGDGSSAYIGYADDFLFVGSSNYINRPLEDPKAKPFKESSNQVMTGLLKGATAGETTERAKNKFRDNYQKLLSSANGDPDSLQAAQFLWWDMRHLSCQGNNESRLPL